MPPASSMTTALAASCALYDARRAANAIVFGTGRLKIGDMVKAGWLNILGVVIITCVAAMSSDRLSEKQANKRTPKEARFSLKCRQAQMPEAS